MQRKGMIALGIALALIIVAVIAVPYYVGWQLPFDPLGGENEPPVAKMSVNSNSVNTKDVVVFRGNKSFDKDGDIIAYNWDFGDGTSGQGILVEHVYETGGWYNVTLTVKDDREEINSQTTQIYVNHRPIARIMIEDEKDNYYIGDVIKFTGSFSTDEDGTIKSYRWDFGDGGFAPGEDAGHKYTALGTYTVSLTVKDDKNATSTAELQMLIQERTYEVTWNTKEKTLFETDGSTDEGETSTLSTNITWENIVSLNITLSWTDNLPIPPLIGLRQNDPDTFRLEVTAPFDHSKKGNSSEGEISTVFSINPQPKKTNIKAIDKETAEDYAMALHGTDLGVGSWEMLVTAVECGDGLLINNGLFPDNGNDWTITITATYYLPEAQEIE